MIGCTLRYSQNSFELRWIYAYVSTECVADDGDRGWFRCSVSVAIYNLNLFLAGRTHRYGGSLLVFERNLILSLAQPRELVLSSHQAAERKPCGRVL